MSCHVHIPELIDTLKLPECQGPPCSKQAQNLKFKSLQLNSKFQPLSSSTKTQPFSQTGCFLAWLSVRLRSKWLWVQLQ